MATGAEFFAQLEKRFNQLPAEEKLDKIVEYQKKQLLDIMLWVLQKQL